MQYPPESSVRHEELNSLTFTIKLLVSSDNGEYPSQLLIRSVEEVLEFESGGGLEWTLLEAHKTGHNQIVTTIKVEGDPDMLQGAKSWLIASIEEHWEGKEEIILKQIL